MYRHCIFCSGELGTNDVLESFPVGQQVAFDGWRGRLWAVCPRCSRWNLSPIEERWEAVEAAEKLFRDARMRVQSENIGLARLPDGTRLVRVGKALQGELAAWRYGSQLRKRRKRYVVVSGAAIAGAGALYSGIAAASGGFLGIFFAGRLIRRVVDMKVVHRINPADDPVGRGALVRRWHLDGISLHPADVDSVLTVKVRDARGSEEAQRRRRGRVVDPDTNDVMALTGAPARALLSRAMVHVNRAGASRRGLEDANRILADAGSANALLREAGLGGAVLGKRAAHDARTLQGPGALAFEMALHEEAERRAMEGELAALTAAWREAEEIAAIADALPGEAWLNRALDRLVR